MNKSAIFAFFAILALLIQPVAADCKYKKDANGFPLGIVPSVTSLDVDFDKPLQKNLTFSLYIESELGTSTSIDCKVLLEVVNESFSLQVELSNYSQETGAAFNERPITVILTPKNLINFASVIETQIKITDADNKNNYAILPIHARFLFGREGPTPTAAITAKPSAVDNFPLATPKPKAQNSTITNIINSVENSGSKYVIAIVAFFFLAALLWVGFNSLQRD
ncbi:hypothetical protein HY989_02910 [Candidatus Micrarchaeota archaeon]|nr:hypothetical protein [Candidatus Micrarchaeota archaeon]